jgi:hypothetical protein
MLRLVVSLADPDGYPGEYQYAIITLNSCQKYSKTRATRLAFVIKRLRRRSKNPSPPTPVRVTNTFVNCLVQAQNIVGDTFHVFRDVGVIAGKLTWCH